MNIDKFIFRFAGIMVLFSVILTQWHHQSWMWMTVFISLNMLQASMTGFCPVVVAVKKAGMKPGRAFK